MQNYLFFFDVNGTLIKDKKNTDLAYKETLIELFKIKNPLGDIETTARSDKAILKNFLHKNDIQFTESLYNIFLKHYEVQLKKYLDKDLWEENDDVKKFVKYLIKRKWNMALLTGNLELGAKYKLESVNLWKYFEVGGYGEDGEIRNDIASSALSKSKKYFKIEKFEDLYVIGDTEKDFKVSKFLNAKSILFAKNKKKKKNLENLNADYVITDFNEAIDIFKER